MSDTKVKDIMSPHPVLIEMGSTLQEAACQMKENDCGILPVGTDNNLQGMITDRDIVIRALCDGKDPSVEKVRDYMTAEVCFCNESDTAVTAAEIMRKHNVSRLVVKDEQGDVSGILSFGNILRKTDDQEEISEVVTCATGKQAA